MRDCFQHMISSHYFQIQCLYLIGILDCICFHREVVLLVLLCDAVAQGIIQPWCEISGQIYQEQDSGKGGMEPQAEKAKKGGGKSSAKSGSAPSLPLEEIKKALEVREKGRNADHVSVSLPSVKLWELCRMCPCWNVCVGQECSY